MDTGVKVGLVIPVFNRRETTLRALRSLSNIDSTGLCVRIFVIDDGSTDATSDAIRERFPDVELIAGDGTLHYAGGTNRGIEAALEWEAVYVVTMNDDSVFHEKFLQRLIETAGENPRSIVGALLLLWSEPHKVFQVAPVWSTWKGGWRFPDDLTAFSVPKEPFDVECIVGNCALFPAKAIEENGLMDENRFPYGWGDAQYTMRMRRAGWNLIIDPHALVWCQPNSKLPPLRTRSFKEILKILFKDERHPLNLKRQFVARWESSPTKLQAVAAFVVYGFILAGKSMDSIVFKQRGDQ